jgi:hypothetical protein
MTEREQQQLRVVALIAQALRTDDPDEMRELIEQSADAFVALCQMRQDGQALH